MKRRKRKRNEEEVQMAPMIDMVFLLLVFFMTVSTMAQDNRPDFDLVESAEAENSTALQTAILININKEESGVRYRLESLEIEPTGFAEALKRWSTAPQSIDLKLRTGPDVIWEDIQPILSQARALGIQSYQFVAWVD